MKRRILALAGIGVLSLSLLAGCQKKADNGSGQTGKEEAKTQELTPLKVGASVTPHSEILAQVKDELAKKGYDLQVVEYNDYVLPNTALEDKELDANFFQHKPYLDDFNAEKGTHLVSVAAVHFEPFGIYGGKTKALADLKDGAKVAVPNDTTNEARALLLLQQEGLIKLKDGAGLQATKVDIAENPKNLDIQELEGAQIPRVIQDVDLACVNGNFALEAKLDAPIAVESSQSEAAKAYANVIVVREGEEKSEKTQALVDAVLSDKVRDYINDTYEGAVVPVF